MTTPRRATRFSRVLAAPPDDDAALRAALQPGLSPARLRAWEGLSERRKTRLLQVARRRMPGAVIALEDISSHHNQAAILRSADGMGVATLALSGASPFSPNPEVALGAESWVTLRRFAGPAEMVAALRADGLRILASDLDPEALPLSDIDLCGPVALLYGNEHSGLCAATLASADARFFLPMVGFAQSYNVSVAAALGAYELRRQREAKGGPLTLDDSPAVALIHGWLDRLDAKKLQSHGLATGTADGT